MYNSLIFIGLLICAGTIAALIWSIRFPQKRIWPPNSYTALTPIFVWVPTFTLCGILIVLGVLNWGEMLLPRWLRFWTGSALIAFGSVVVWTEVFQFGIAKTGGAKGSLRTKGTYRYSRNPQYVADMLIVIGWMLLSASGSVWLVGFFSIATLILAPFAEEPWLEVQYGSEYLNYIKRVPRFFWKL